MSFHRFYVGDVLAVLKTMDSESIHCVVTSPPYWGLRDYGVLGQMGMEPTPEDYVVRLVRAFREVRRVLRQDGTLWLNMGDCYAWPGQGGSWDAQRRQKNTGRCLCTAQANRGRYAGNKQKDLLGLPWRVAFALQDDGWYLRADVIWAKTNPMPESVIDRPTRSHEYIFLLAKSRRYWYDALAISEPSAKVPIMRNKRSVWTIPTEPFPGAHFAVFPRALAETCVLAGCPPLVCSVCGAPYVRETVRTGHVNRRTSAHAPGHCATKTSSTGWAPTTVPTDRFLPACECAADAVPGTVLDPFGGSGTVTYVAMAHHRNSVYVDLNEIYADMALDRCGFAQESPIDYHKYEILRMDDLTASDAELEVK